MSQQHTIHKYTQLPVSAQLVYIVFRVLMPPPQLEHLLSFLPSGSKVDYI